LGKNWILPIIPIYAKASLNSKIMLKGQVGDEINVLMAACAWNLRKWLIATAIFLFWQKVGLCMVRSRYFCESLFWASQPKQAAKT
jgi:hypothetical protein